MRALLIGLFTVLKHLFMQPVTLEYPEKKRIQSDEFRGKPKVNLGKDGCVGCGICKKVCPSGAIEYIKDNEGKVKSYSFNLSKCIFCGNCMYYCPQKAIKLTGEYELGTANKEDLVIEYEGEKND